MIQALPPTPHDDHGFTLVELLVYVLLLGMILAAGFGLLANSFRGSNSVQGAADASRDGQTIARTITTSVRNASHVTVNSDGTVMTVQMKSGRCQAWKVSGTALSAHFTYGSATGANALPASGWTVLSDGVDQKHPSIPFFTAEGGGVEVRFTVATANAPTLIETLTVPRLPPTGASRCLV